MRLSTARLRAWLADRLAGALWPLPLAAALGALVAAALTLSLDRLLPPGAGPFFLPASPEGVRSLLATLAGALAGMASLVLSVTVVVLTLAAQQLGPRIVPLFVRDRTTRTAIAVFLAALVYTLAVTGAVHGGPQPFLPAVSASAALAFGLAALVVLIAFVHGAARSVRADRVVARLAAAAEARLAERPPRRGAPPGPAVLALGGRRPLVVRAREAGYVQTVDVAALLDHAVREELVVFLRTHPGAFVLPGTPLAVVLGFDDAAQAHERAVRGAVVVGPVRTPADDLLWELHGLVEIALRALSPGINDPRTAVACVHWLGVLIARWFACEPPAAVLTDADGIVRLVRPVPSARLLLGATLGEVRRYAGPARAVLEALARVLAGLAPQAPDGRSRRAVALELARLRRAVRRDVADPGERLELLGEIARARAALRVDRVGAEV